MSAVSFAAKKVRAPDLALMKERGHPREFVVQRDLQRRRYIGTYKRHLFTPGTSARRPFSSCCS